MLIEKKKKTWKVKSPSVLATRCTNDLPTGKELQPPSSKLPCTRYSNGTAASTAADSSNTIPREGETSSNCLRSDILSTTVRAGTTLVTACSTRPFHAARPKFCQAAEPSM